MMSQMKSRNHVSNGNPSIINKEIAMPMIGTNGTIGVLNGRGRSGFVLRIIQTPAQTITNASKVPMLTNSPRIEIGMTEAKMATKIPTKIDEM